jgi:hypothetical protein
MYLPRRRCSDPMLQLVADSGVGAGWSQSSSEISRAVQTPCRPPSPYPKPPLPGHELTGVRHGTETVGIRTFVRKISPNSERLLACRIGPGQ